MTEPWIALKSLPWEEKYRQIIQLGQRLPPFPESERRPSLIVKGCQSRLWLKAAQNKGGLLALSGDSEGLISKGLLALSIAFCSGKSPKKVLEESLCFIDDLDLPGGLTPGRANGLLALKRQILSYAKAFELLSAQSQGAESGSAAQ